MAEIEHVNLPQVLRSVQQRWVKAKGKERDEIYAREFAPEFVKRFAKLPLSGAPESLQSPRALISVLGFSWQPVMLMAAWVQPERMLIIGTEESLDEDRRIGDEWIVDVICRLAGVERARLQTEKVEDPAESEIYRLVRDFLRSSQIPPSRVFIDPTGGKKSMSASAALASFLYGSPLVYVDYHDYSKEHRIPLAGTEYPRLLTNPLEELGELEYRYIFQAFDRSDFTEARHLASRLAQRLYEPRQAECIEKLAFGYEHWDRFEFEQSRDMLHEARSWIDRFASRGNWSWAPGLRRQLDGNLRVLDELERAQASQKPASLEQGRILLAWYLASADRMLKAGKVSLALLLVHAALERYVDLCLWIDHALDDVEPDFSDVEDKIDQTKFERAGRRLFDKRYKEEGPRAPLMLRNGAQLLAALEPCRLELDDLGPIRGVVVNRNKCEYTHGLSAKTPRRNEVERYLNKAVAIVGRLYDERARLDADLHDCRFPKMLE